MEDSNKNHSAKSQILNKESLMNYEVNDIRSEREIFFKQIQEKMGGVGDHFSPMSAFKPVEIGGINSAQPQSETQFNFNIEPFSAKYPKTNPPINKAKVATNRNSYLSMAFPSENNIFKNQQDSHIDRDGIKQEPGTRLPLQSLQLGDSQNNANLRLLFSKS